MQAHQVPQLPTELYGVLFTFILEIDKLVELRLVSKRFKQIIDELITAPKFAATILFSLNTSSRQLSAFIAFYKLSNTKAFSQLITKANKEEPLNIFEKICLGYLNNEKGPHPLTTLLKAPEIFEMLSEFSFGAVKNFLIPFAYENRGPERLFERKEKELKQQTSPLHAVEKKAFEHTIALMVIRGFAHGGADFNVALFERVIEICKELNITNEYINRCLESLSITIAAKKTNKTPTDYDVIRRGFNGYINLQRCDLQDAPLQNAKLTNLEIHWCNFEGANLNGANFENTRFGALVNLNNADLRNANLKNTKWIVIPLDDRIANLKWRFNDLAARTKVAYGEHEVKFAIAQNILHAVKKHPPEKAIEILEVAIASNIFTQCAHEQRKYLWSLIFWKLPSDSIVLNSETRKSSSADLLMHEIHRLQSSINRPQLNRGL